MICKISLCLCFFLIAQPGLGDAKRSRRSSVSKYDGHMQHYRYMKRAEEYSLGYRLCDLYPALRHDCGYFGIDEEGCNRRGCCYVTALTSGISWCYYARDMIEDQCMYAPGERTQCGEYGIEKDDCLVEGCCWQPKDDPDTPWCFHALEEGGAQPGPQPGPEPGPETPPEEPSADCQFTTTQGECSVSCGSGIRTTTNIITSPPTGNGQACPPEEHVEYCHTGVECGGCDQNLVGPSGVVTSPNYPGTYPDSVYCAITIQGLPGDSVTLTFDTFHLESCCDSLYISDGVTEESHTGSVIPPVFQSSSNSVGLYFSTDSSVGYDGFSATYVVGE